MADEVSQSDAEQAQIRLQSIRRVLDDFDKAVNYVRHTKTDVQALNAEIPKLKEERDALNAEIEKVKEKLIEEQKRFEQVSNDHAAIQAERTTDLQRQIQSYEQRLAEVKKQHETQIVETETQYRAMIAAKNAELADAQARFKAISEQIEAYKAAAARL